MTTTTPTLPVPTRGEIHAAYRLAQPRRRAPDHTVIGRNGSRARDYECAYTGARYGSHSAEWPRTVRSHEEQADHEAACPAVPRARAAYVLGYWLACVAAGDAWPVVVLRAQRYEQRVR